MKLYFAPLEGITTYTYRNAHAKMFGECDEYFAPFISPSENEKISKKGIKDILPELNGGVCLKPQVLTNNAVAFLKFCDKIKFFGYEDININLGCPSGTVVKKGRGSGFLKKPDMLDEFLYEIFSKSDMKISVKTRIGYSSPEEMDTLMEIYNKYPISELIIHPRTREDLYKGVPNYEAFEKAYKSSKNEVCYNGNVYTKEDYDRIVSDYPEIVGVMLGRGAIKNPALFREIRGGEKITTEELVEFSKRLIDDYNERFCSEIYTLHKMKEIWMYMLQNYPEETKIAKAIKKSNKLTEFKTAIQSLPKL